MRAPLPAGTRIAAKRVGENLATWRKLMGLTSQQVAERAGVSRGTISRLENGDASTNLATFFNVCDVLEILDLITDAAIPYNTDLGRERADQKLPQRVRKPS